jgi:hypothetical protein
MKVWRKGRIHEVVVKTQTCKPPGLIRCRGRVQASTGEG